MLPCRHATVGAHDGHALPPEQYDAEGQRAGRLSENIEDIREALLEVLAQMAVDIDYPDEDYDVEGDAYGDLIDSRPVNILRPKPLLKNYMPVFEFRKDVWECSSTGESQILVPKESSKKGRRFAYAPLGFVFSFGIPYRFAVRLKCRTDESTGSETSNKADIPCNDESGL